MLALEETRQRRRERMRVKERRRWSQHGAEGNNKVWVGSNWIERIESDKEDIGVRIKEPELVSIASRVALEKTWLRKKFGERKSVEERKGTMEDGEWMERNKPIISEEVDLKKETRMGDWSTTKWGKYENRFKGKFAGFGKMLYYCLYFSFTYKIFIFNKINVKIDYESDYLQTPQPIINKTKKNFGLSLPFISMQNVALK